MGERKVLNKYFPPDFDPSLIPRRKRPKNQQIEVRMMLPFSLQCETCGEYMYRGKKFNSRKEEVLEDDYLGIRIFRFYIKCISCSSEITFKTDPKNGDYVAEHGCSRNFELWRDKEAAEEEAVKKREDEEQGDSMKALENRTLDSKREMDILDALDEIKAINQRHAKVDTDALLHNITHKNQAEAEEEAKKQLEEDQELVRRVFQQKKRNLDDMNGASTAEKTHEGPANTKPVAKETTTKPLSVGLTSTTSTAAPTATSTAPIIVKRKALASSTKTGVKKSKAKKPAAPVVTSLVAEYSDSD
ncbi:TPA: hypothetical protein N0F65_008411 [Lagenidium giganteum]|uniref:Splicing factor YJU2 n=1 Tax=Lagenidium giganteum TaxID=4803 RepID=A0AAV2YXL2_9STRA|nr:TPA: hypothetical protein N0F65_008411 [Lagenidium giganteum]